MSVIAAVNSMRYREMCLTSCSQDNNSNSSMDSSKGLFWWGLVGSKKLVNVATKEIFLCNFITQSVSHCHIFALVLVLALLLWSCQKRKL